MGSTGVGKWLSNGIGSDRRRDVSTDVRSIVVARRTTPALQALAAAVDDALRDPDHRDDRARAEAMVPAMRALLASRDPVPLEAYEPLDGAAVGNLLHADPAGRFHILAVVFPEGTSSGVHHHGCWGVIGYLRGGDEETRYRATDHGGEAVVLEEHLRRVWHQGDITFLLPPDDGWHRVRNHGPGTAVSIHVLCRSPDEHPHSLWDRATGAVTPYPFVEVAPDRWRAQIAPSP